MNSIDKFSIGMYIYLAIMAIFAIYFSCVKKHFKYMFKIGLVTSIIWAFISISCFLELPYYISIPLAVLASIFVWKLAPRYVYNLSGYKEDDLEANEEKDNN